MRFDQFEIVDVFLDGFNFFLVFLIWEEDVLVFYIEFVIVEIVIEYFLELYEGFLFFFFWELYIDF